MQTRAGVRRAGRQGQAPPLTPGPQYLAEIRLDKSLKGYSAIW